MALRLNLFAGKSIFAGTEVFVHDAPIVAKLSYLDIFIHAALVTTGNGTTDLTPLLEVLVSDGTTTRDSKLVEKSGDGNTLIRRQKGVFNGAFSNMMLHFEISFTSPADAGGTISRTLNVLVNGVSQFVNTFDHPSVKAAGYSKYQSGTLYVPTDASIQFTVTTAGTYGGAGLSNINVRLFGE
jgi:hypothetical protein